MASEPIRDEPKQGGGSSENTLGELIVFFVLFFAVFFVIGFNNGRKDLSKPEDIKNFVISRTHLVHSGDTNCLVYGRSNRDVWWLDVKSNSGRLEGSMHPLAMLEFKNQKTIGGDSSPLRSLFGSAPAVFTFSTLTELVTMLTKGGDYRVILRIGGAGTGYSAGYLISDRLFPPKYDHPAIISWLWQISDSDSSEIKRRWLINHLSKWQETAKKSAQQIIDGESDKKLRALIQSLQEPTYNPKNEDFSVFAELVSAPNQSL